MSLPQNTRSIALLAGCTVAQIFGALYAGKLVPPPKTASGEYAWCDEDVARIRAALAVDRRRRRAEAPGLMAVAV
jgi:hypothetical protein